MLGRSSTLVLFCAGLVTVYSCATGVNETEDDDSGPTTSLSSTGGAATGAGGESSTEAASTAESTSAMSSAASTAASGTSVASSSAQSSSSTGGPCSLGPPTNLMGCPSCGINCDSPWPASWSAVAGATHYIVEYTCITPNAFQTSNTSVDLCNEVGMCNNTLCAYGAGPVSVKACDSTCCSLPAQVPINETPIACGGGVCC